MAPAEQRTPPPRLVVAGLAGDTGKSLVTLGLVRALRARGVRVAVFKKGPDFIDAAWLGLAADTTGRNLDTFMMPHDQVLRSVEQASTDADFVVVEGNRGLFDGMDAAGTHSTATLAKLLGAPVLLVVDTTKMTRTAAALVLGCRTLDPDVQLGGVVLNRVGTTRQEDIVRQCLEAETDVPVLGALPRLTGEHLPSRHLGLVTAIEHPDTTQALDEIEQAVEEALDVPAIIAMARGASPSTRAEATAGPADSPLGPEDRPRIGVLRDRAFSFYYPENLEALEAAGAELVFLSPLADSTLPELDGLYAGGGFPEVHARELAANESFRRALAERIAEGLPVWAECGGLSYLSRTLVWEGEEYPMVGALPVVVEQTARPQGHGYVQGQVVADNPFLPPGTELRGHEFHYSRVIEGGEELETVATLERGTGLGRGRDGLRVHNVVATYTHLHALGTPSWAPALVAAARHRPALAQDGARPRPQGRNGSGSSLLRPDSRQRSQGSPRAALRRAVEGEQLEELERLVSADRRTVRLLLGMTYQPDEQLRQSAARGLAIAGRHHPRVVQNALRRLVWAMNDESGTNATSAPEVLRILADEHPELLLPILPDLLRLTGDEGLREGLSATLRIVARRCPGKLGPGLNDLLNDQIRNRAGGPRGV